MMAIIANIIGNSIIFLCLFYVHFNTTNKKSASLRLFDENPENQGGASGY
jgi:hypothetical protein